MEVLRTVRRIPADDALLACSTLSRVDHVDAHMLVRGDGASRSPQAWAREILEGPAAPTRLRLRAGWTMLGIRLHGAAPDVVAGWRIAHDDAEYVRLHAHSPIGLTGQLVTRITHDRVAFATFVELTNPAARMLWARVLPTHLTVVRSLVEGAAARAA